MKTLKLKELWKILILEYQLLLNRIEMEFPSLPPTRQGLTWHHNSYEKWVMELIPRAHHSAPGPVQSNLHPNQQGGMKIWGRT
jgi:hypothetical protein